MQESDIAAMPPQEITKFVHLYQWQAPERYWTPKDRSWYTWYAFAFVIFIFLAALTEQYFLILTLIALLLLIYAQAAVPPKIRKFEITNLGLIAYDTLFKWRDIDYYWVTERVAGGMLTPLNGQTERYRLINIDMPSKAPTRLSIMIGEGDEEEIVFTLLNYIPYGDPDEVSDDPLSKVLYGKHIPLRNYAPTGEYYPETDEFPEQFIEDQPDDMDGDGTVTSSELKERKRRKQAELAKKKSNKAHHKKS